jgi:hydroxypyruvate isomerase
VPFAATILRMVNRRVFGKLMAATVAAQVGAQHGLMAQMAEKPGLAQTQFSVMIWALNSKGTFEENLERVAKAGYSHVELVGEFRKWSDADWERILGRMKALGISVDAVAGMKAGFADMGGGDAYLTELKALMPVMQRLDSKQIILVSGKRVEGAAAGEQHKTCVETLKRAGALLKDAGIVAVIEPIDRLENPPIYLDGVEEAFEIVREVGSPNVKVLYDLYHEQRTHGNLIEKLEKNIDAVALIHIADVPGRHEPGTGEVNYRNVYRKLVELKYKGGIAMEFYPTGDVVETLRKAREEAMRA